MISWALRDITWAHIAPARRHVIFCYCYSRPLLLSLSQIAEPEGYGKKGTSKKSKSAFADGTALPAKRPRVSNVAEPDASRSNRRVPAITDFFNSIATPGNPTDSEANPAKGLPANSRLVKSQGRAAEAASAEVDAGTANLHDLRDTQSRVNDVEAETDRQQGAQASNAVPSQPRQAISGGLPQPQQASRGVPSKLQHLPQDAQSADAHQQIRHQSKANAKTPSERASRRDIMADAAMRRIAVQSQDAGQSTASGQDCNHLPVASAGTERVQLSVNDTCSDGSAKQDDLDEHTAHVSAVIDLVDDENDANEGLLQTCSGQTSSRVQSSCPICGHVWPEQTSNQEMNDHVDVCLLHQIL